MVDAIAIVYRCPNCGYEIITNDQLENGTIECGNCGVEMMYAGHEDITSDEN